MTGTVRTWSAPHSAVERPRLFALHGMRCNRSGAERSADQGPRPRHHSLPGDTVRSCRRRTLEVHNEAAFENAFRCRSVALSAAPLIIGKVKEIGAGWPICVVSPDLGGGKRTDLCVKCLKGPLVTRSARRLSRNIAVPASSRVTCSRAMSRTCFVSSLMISLAQEAPWCGRQRQHLPTVRRKSLPASRTVCLSETSSE